MSGRGGNRYLDPEVNHKRILRKLAERIRTNTCTSCGRPCSCHLVMRGLGLSNLPDQQADDYQETMDRRRSDEE